MPPLDNIYKALDEEIARLRNVRALLEANLPSTNGHKATTPKKKTGGPKSAAARKRISIAQKRRWREIRRQQKLAAK